MADAVLKLAYEVSRITEEKVDLIEDVMQRTKVLALNARLEAARAGAAGSAFSVVAQEMSAVANDIRSIAGDLPTFVVPITSLSVSVCACLKCAVMRLFVD